MWTSFIELEQTLVKWGGKNKKLNLAVKFLQHNFSLLTSNDLWPWLFDLKFVPQDLWYLISLVYQFHDNWTNTLGMGAFLKMLTPLLLPTLSEKQQLYLALAKKARQQNWKNMWFSSLLSLHEKGTIWRGMSEYIN